MLDADPVIAGITYLESDLGQDTGPDYFEVTFEGGSATTQMTQFVINGDQDQNGALSDGDMFFDISEQYPGTGGYHNFQFHAGGSAGVNAGDITGVSVSEDGLRLTVNIRNFEAGDKLAFTIDVDEVERLRVDEIASGVEFEGSLFTGTFVDEHYTFSPRDIALTTRLGDGQLQDQYPGVFFDEYDALLDTGEDLSQGSLDLVRDNQQGNENRTAGAIDAWDLTPKPIEISGSVYHDANVNCQHDADEDGIAGVHITLQKFNSDTAAYETVASTVTDAGGHYVFGSDLGLLPGKFRIVETQPEGYLDVGASAGTVAGTASGIVANSNVLSEINVPLGGTVAENYDFKEVLPATLQGNVYHDRNDDGVRGPGEEGIANVLIQVTRIGAKDSGLDDPFIQTEPVLVRTDANGHYEVTGLPPGIYQVTEINNYPPGENPLVGFVDGKDTVGRVNSVQVGSLANDQFNGVLLCAGENGMEYNFGELKPASIGGYVSLATPQGDCLDPTDPDHTGIAGVEIRLLDSGGNLVASTRTDETGHYEFNNLGTGTYTIVEVQPAGYLDGDESVGTVAGSQVGRPGSNDRLTGIVLVSGSAGTNYNFCEHLPAALRGSVWHDVNNDGIFGASESGIAGVTIQLFDRANNLVAETVTDADGRYAFDNLYAGEYRIVEIQPGDYVDGKDSLGGIDGNLVGQAENDSFRNINLLEGQQGVKYDFGEIRLASIQGTVHLDPNGDCVYNPSAGDQPLAGVTMQLLNADGNVVAETVTNAQGQYSFDHLLPGTWSVRQVQPGDVFTAGQRAGDGGGTASENLIANVVVQSGQRLTRYDFCEQEAAEIRGRVWEDGPAFETADGRVPDNYRDLRDGVYQSGVDTPLAGVRMELWYYVDPVSGEIAPRRVTLGEVLNSGQYAHLGTDPNAAVWMETTASGEYRFTGLQAGNYIVLETQPDGYVDANDIPGSTSGFTYNSEVEAALAPTILSSTFSNTQIMDSIVNIRVNSGDVSIQNNFSEVQALANPDEPVIPITPQRPVPPGNPLPPTPPLRPGLGLAGAQSANFTAYIGGGRSVVAESLPVGMPYTWHLSVVNGGQPRGDDAETGGPSWLQAGYLTEQDWNRFDMTAGQWTFTTTAENGTISIDGDATWFGMIDGTPLAGDFDGDGNDEVVVYRDGYWMIDLNGNGRWDIDDLMARLGNAEDRPVVGDWDGDGKDDIGIFGPIWDGDDLAIETEPGIPDPDNQVATRPKNIPPATIAANEGSRVMRLSSFGDSRRDVIDHIFGYGDEEDVPVTGDWNGDAIRTIGLFQGGQWQIDLNGDGRFDFEDARFSFRREGDIPLVGDFNGDGIEQVAVYRNGTWIIDSNGNRELDATDKVFEMGGRNDVPVVGDWDGDGVDEPALYQSRGTQASNVQ